MRAGPSEQRERSTPTARNARRGARQITTLILTAALIIEPIYGAVRRPGPDAGWTGETGRRLHAVQAERKAEPETLAPKASPWRASPGAISAGGAPRPGGVSVEGNGEISFLINPPEFDEQLRLQELDYIKKRNELGRRVENTKYYQSFDQAEYDRLKTELTRKMQAERAKRTDESFRVEVLPDGTVRMVRSIPAGQTRYIPGKDPEDKNSYTREMTSQIVEVAAPKHAAILTPDELFKKWDNSSGDSYLKSLEAFETTMGQQAQIMQTTLDDAEAVAQRNETSHQKRVQESIEAAKEQRAMLEGILSNLAGGMSLGKSWSMYHQQQMQSAITGEWADALGLDADVLSAMFGKGSLKSKLTGIVEGRAYNAIGAAMQAATGIPASIFTSGLRKHMANAQKVRARAEASKFRPEDIVGGVTWVWRNAQYHQAGQVALQVVETAAAVVLNTVGNLFAGAGSLIMAGYYATKQAYLGSLTGGTKGALAGLASGVVSGALTYAVGAYGGAYLGEAAKSVGVNVNASYTFDGGWSGGLGFNFSGIEGKGLGFGANLQFAEGRGAVGGGIDLSFGRGGGRTALTLNSDNTARIGYTTAGSGPQNNLRGNYGVTLDKDGIAGVDASASYTGYHGGSLFGQGTSTTLTNNAGLFYNRDGSYGITTSTNIGIADAYGFGVNRVGANTNERYTWGPGGGFQGTTQNITTNVGFQSKEQALENIRKRIDEVYAKLEDGNPTAEEEAALREELQFLKQRDAQADPWTAMYNTVMARTDIPQSVKDEIRKNPDLLLDHDYMKNVFLSLGEEGGSIPIAGTDRSRNGIIDNVVGAVGDAIDWLGGESSSDLGYVDQNGKFVYRICFVAGTKIRTRDGFKNIEEILEGDYVLSLNEKTGEQRFSRVTQTYIRQADRIYELTFADGTVIETTWSHPFYIKGKGWIQAKDLRVGEVGVTAARTDLAITGIRVDARYETVYNFTVEDDHNYYVSEAQVLVHNQGYFESKALVWSESARREYLAEKYGTTNLAAIEKEFLEAYDAAHALAYNLALKRTGHLDPDPTGERSAALSQEIESLKASCQTQVCRDAVDRGLRTGHVDGRIMVSVSGSAASNMGYTPMGGGNALIRPRAQWPGGRYPFRSRGSTGRTTPLTINEHVAMRAVRANASAGMPVPMKQPMGDSRWPASDGWVKMRQNVNGIEIHYVRNTRTGDVDDFKFK